MDDRKIAKACFQESDKPRSARPIRDMVGQSVYNHLNSNAAVFSKPSAWAVADSQKALLDSLLAGKPHNCQLDIS